MRILHFLARSAYFLPSLIIVTIISSSLKGQVVWEPVGPDDTNRLSNEGVVQDVDLAFGEGGILYAAYATFSDLYVKKWDGTKWILLGEGDISVGNPGVIDLEVGPNGIPYIIFDDGGLGGKVSVKKFTDGAWTSVGSDQGISDGIANGSMAINSSNVPYIIYSGFSTGGAAVVKKFIGGDWETVGDEGFSVGYVEYPDIAFDDFDVPYLSYRDAGEGVRTIVKKLENDVWVQISSGPVSTGVAYYTKIAIDTGNVPIVTYRDEAYGGKAIVKRSGATSFYNLGPSTGISTGIAYSTGIAADETGKKYLVYSDHALGEKIVAKRYDAGIWHVLGKEGFSIGRAYGDEIALHPNGTPHVIFIEEGLGKRAVVKKFNGEEWVDLGDVSFAQTNTNSVNISIGYNGTPHVSSGAVIANDSMRVFHFVNNNWQQLSTSSLNFGRSDAVKLSIDRNNNPVIAMQGSQNITVKKHNGSDWNALGQDGIATKSPMAMALTSDNVPVIVSHDFNSNQLIVKKFNGTTWQNIGQAISEGEPYEVDISIDSEDHPWIAYQMDWNIVVKRFVNSEWQVVGSDPVVDSAGLDVTLDVSTDMAYILYRDMDRDHKLSMKKFNGSIWEFVGKPAFTERVSISPSPDFAMVGSVPFVAYRNNNSKVSVKRYNGLNWEDFGEELGSGIISNCQIEYRNNTLFILYQSDGAFVKKHANPCNLELGYQVVHQTCTSLSDGALSIDVSGGTGPYTYTWSNGANTRNIADLQAGVYSVTVKDQNGCTSRSASLEVELLNKLESTLSVEPISCHDYEDGILEFTASEEAVLPVQYFWSNDSTSPRIENLGPGEYIITALDARGCVMTDTTELIEPDSIQITGSITSPTCPKAANAYIDLEVTGGTPAYTYLWSTGSTLEDFTGFSGYQKVVVTDSRACVDSAGFDIPGLEDLVLEINGPDSAVSGTTIILEATPGYISYDWELDYGTIISGQGTHRIEVRTTIVPDMDGIYEEVALVEVLNEDSCSAWKLFEFGLTFGESACDLDIAADYDDDYCPSVAPEGYIELAPTGGTAPYTFEWSNGDTTQLIDELSAGEYFVTLTDKNDCQIKDYGPFAIEYYSDIQAEAWADSPTCSEGDDGSIDLEVTGGVEPYTFEWSNGASTEDQDMVTPGNYLVTITDAEGCLGETEVEVPQLDPLEHSAEIVNSNCFGDPTGSIDLTIFEDEGSEISFLWSNGATTEDIDNLEPGIYSVTVTMQLEGDPGAQISSDDNILEVDQCIYEFGPFEVDQSTGPEIELITTEISCYGQNDGRLSAVVTGGAAPYTYLWSNGGTNGTITGLVHGKYSLIVTDQEGCVRSDSVDLIQPAELNLSFEATQSVCFGLSDGTIESAVSGGREPYSYLWDHGPNSENLSDLPAGIYTLNVTDKSQCMTSGTITISEQDPVAATISGPDSLLTGEQASYTATAGMSNYAWELEHGTIVSGQGGASITITSEILTGMGENPVDQLDVTVTDDLGCMGHDTFTIYLKAPDQITGLKDRAIVKVWPNPFNETLLMNTKSLTYPITTEIWSLDGVLIYRVEYSKMQGDGIIEIQSGSIKAGTYLIQVENSQKSMWWKIIKQ